VLAPEDAGWVGFDLAEEIVDRTGLQVGKPLFGPLAGCYGARRGTYRSVYRIDEDSRVIHVLDIGHRSEIYRRPQR
jgi:mRNA-degrading endonuclease RelE of RelBE toxin-antitoxin system